MLEAIESGDPNRHREELGDLMLQVVFQSRIRAEEGAFTIDDVCRGITEKLVRRHPHVWGEAPAADPDAARASWDRVKVGERADRGDPSMLGGIPPSLPSLPTAAKLGQRASQVGFDWPDAPSVRPKLDEELQELDEAIATGQASAIEHEIGDVLFTVVNLARHLKVDPDLALRRANARFRHRFGAIERSLAGDGLSVKDVTMEELDRRWTEAKSAP